MDKSLESCQKIMATNRSLFRVIPESDWVIGLLMPVLAVFLFYEVCGAFVSIVRHHNKKTPLSTD